MQQRSFRVLLLLPCLLLVSALANAQAWWHTPGKADVLTNGGLANTLIVKIVNLTPYEIDLNENALPYLHSEPTNLKDMYGSTAMDPDEAKSFMFAPLGVPPHIPRVPAEAFKTPPDPLYVNNTTHPYTFVLSWDDRGGNVNDSWLTWTIHDVACVDPRCSASKKDIPLGMFITRVNPSSDLTAADYFHLAKDVLVRITQVIAVVVMPENPIAWKDFILGTGEITKGAVEFNAAQNAGDAGRKWYFAAYPFPAAGFYCANVPVPDSCSPSNSQATDAAEANWSAGNGGWTEQEIVVTVELKRGREASPAYGCYPGTYGKLGTVPVAVVTVMTMDEWIMANLPEMANPVAGEPASTGPNPPKSAQIKSAAEMIRDTLEQTGRSGAVTLHSIITNLNAEQRQVLRDAFHTWRAGKPLQPQHQTLLHMLAVHLRNQVRQ